MNLLLALGRAGQAETAADGPAFSATGLSETLATLITYNIEHTCRRQAGTKMWQVFLFDPNGARVELDFSADEVQSRG